jgi:hypothetical protein
MLFMMCCGMLSEYQKAKGLINGHRDKHAPQAVYVLGMLAVV